MSRSKNIGAIVCLVAFAFFAGWPVWRWLSAKSVSANLQRRTQVLVEKDPRDPELRYLLGTALLHQHKFAEAQAELIAALKLKPGMGEAYGDLALAASENKEYPLALQALDARAKLLPETPATYFLRATCYDHLRAFKQAAESYRQFLAVAGGKYPDQEWQARHRLIAIEPRK